MLAHHVADELFCGQPYFMLDVIIFGTPGQQP